jgi:hypothetical protein
MNLEESLLWVNEVKGSVENVLNTVRSEHKERIEQAYEVITRKQATLDFLSSIYKTESANNTKNIDFQRIESPDHLFQVLIENYEFELAGKYLESPIRLGISIDALINPFLYIDERVHPSSYWPILSKLITFNLNANHELLKRLKWWCCSLADKFDETMDPELGLDAGILLLEVSTLSVRH